MMTLFVQTAVFSDIALSHLSITVTVRIALVTGCLNSPCFLYSAPYCFGFFTFLLSGQFVVAYRWNMDVNVDTVHKRSGYPAHIILYLPQSTGAFVLWIRGISAGAGIHGCNQHKF